MKGLMEQEKQLRNRNTMLLAPNKDFRRVLEVLLDVKKQVAAMKQEVAAAAAAAAGAGGGGKAASAAPSSATSGHAAGGSRDAEIQGRERRNAKQRTRGSHIQICGYLRPRPKATFYVQQQSAPAAFGPYY
ncbi:hypothetical protein Vretifemale_11095 [Volvox reticuliferus]|uniref:Uncharacterized protein n=1 Tax=Volvox reticuliferus TaxID=1737510 RepID=A0A8J4FS61_9CHLO|nr:hypothetical protein Vretifemale_11095 [Volvox reticuliferus]